MPSPGSKTARGRGKLDSRIIIIGEAPKSRAQASPGFVSAHASLLGHEPLGRNKAGLEHLPEIAAELGPQTTRYSVGAYEYSLPFYLRRTMVMVEHAEDGMMLGLQKQPQLWIPKHEDFVRGWVDKRAAGDKAIAIMRPDIYAALQAQATKNPWANCSRGFDQPLQ